MNAPSNLKLEIPSDDAKSIKLSWSKVNGAADYVVAWREKGVKKLEESARISGESYKIPSLNPMTVYEVMVQAWNGDKSSSLSPTKDIRTGLDAPSNLKWEIPSDDVKSIKLSWSKVDGATDYVVAWREKGVKKPEESERIPGESYKIPSLNPMIVYEVMVQAWNGDSSSLLSPIKDICTGLDAPSNLKVVSNKEKSIDVEWSEVKSATDYQVKWRKKGEKKWEQSERIKDKRYTISRSKPSISYEFEVSARNYGGNDGGSLLSSSDFKRIRIPAILKPPKLDKPKKSGEGKSDDRELKKSGEGKSDDRELISISWGEVEDATKYKIILKWSGDEGSATSGYLGWDCKDGCKVCYTISFPLPKKETATYEVTVKAFNDDKDSSKESEPENIDIDPPKEIWPQDSSSESGSGYKVSGNKKLSSTQKKRIRKNFGKRRSDEYPMPSLLSIQLDSYKEFLRKGLQAAFESVFPIKAVSGKADLEFVSYRLENPKYDVDECKMRGATYAASLEVVLRLVLYADDLSGSANKSDTHKLEKTGRPCELELVYGYGKGTTSKSVKLIKEGSREVYMCDIPLMTESGTFVINGTERVIVSQLHRSPGVFFSLDQDRAKAGGGRPLHSSKIIPYRGSWLDFEFDSKDLLSTRIDRRRIDSTVLLRALGYQPQEILEIFYEYDSFSVTPEGLRLALIPERLRGETAPFDIKDKDGKEIVKAKKRITARHVRAMRQAGLDTLDVGDDYLVREDSPLKKRLYQDVVDSNTGEVIANANDELTLELIGKIRSSGVESFRVLYTNDVDRGPFISETLAKDLKEKKERNTPVNQNQAQIEIYKLIRPGEPSTRDAAQSLFHNLFFNDERYNLSEVGRMKFNRRVGRKDEWGSSVLYDHKYFSGRNDRAAKELVAQYKEGSDILDVLKILIDIKNGGGEVDDIDHLGNRRVRRVGEMAENQFRIGLIRVERAVKERLGMPEIEDLMPQDLINPKPVSAVIKEFFGSSQLSQFMDQNNPLSEVTHKRRISALGPGGLTRERAGFEVRDVHPTHYGRVCPIETPEGPNIGLINSLAVYARPNDYGFLETPYRKVVDGRVGKDVDYLSAIDEGRYKIAQANATLDDDNNLTDDLVTCRYRNETAFSSPAEVDYMDVSPKQIVSVAAALIPFLEHDDANRALMGSNMQRQAVPTLKSEKPLVGTGMELKVAADSGVMVIARRGGTVDSVDASRIVIRVNDNEIAQDEAGVDIYNLIKYRRSNQDTCINQRPLVGKGDKIAKGDVLADGSATDMGELSLGQNILVAIMPWNGFNFEDSILISERIVEDDRYTTVHIEELVCKAFDNDKRGPDEITADIPNVNEGDLAKLDATGIVEIGAEVEAGDILVGKVTPKDETQQSPEDKLLQAIFNEKASDVKDSSLRVPSGMSGTVIDVRVLTRDDKDKDDRAITIESFEERKVRKDVDDEYRIIENDVYSRLERILDGKVAEGGPEDLASGSGITKEYLERIGRSRWFEIRLADESAHEHLENTKERLEAEKKRLDKYFEEKKEKIGDSVELRPPTKKMVKVYLAVKRRLQAGDKMAGRHGNKGVISMIAPVEDMPCMEDGTPVDIVLNPLGVPSRMNVGQVLEAHLGWAAKELGNEVSRMIDRFESEGLKKNERASQLRSFLGEIYAPSDASESANPVVNLNDKELIELAENLKGGIPMATPVFDGAGEEEIKRMLELAKLPRSGQARLFDGRTGEPFDRPVTVGYMYMLKLNHLVDDKMHSRSTGPYSLVTQQPLGGKAPKSSAGGKGQHGTGSNAQGGGQRFGEMEVWALEAYGASYTLQEMLTVKSDDIKGRSDTYRNIVKGEFRISANMPESFNVLMKEIRSLGIDIDLENDE